MKNLFLLPGIVMLSLLFQWKSKNAEHQVAPNFIFIITDDQRWDALGYAGNPIIRTPEMDLLAREGVYFEKAFVTTPICASSRASILSGLYERSHDFTFQKPPLDSFFMENSFPVLLKDERYDTGYYGKFGIKYPNAEALFDQAELYDRNNNESDKKGYFYKKIDSVDVHLTRYTGNKGRNFIKEASLNKPFCLTLSFSAPYAHDGAEEQYFWQKKLDTFYSQITVPVPPLSDSLSFSQLPKEVREGFNRTRWYWRYDTPDKYQKSIKGYYRMISGIDAEIGLLRRTLEEKGIADNTVIVLIGDNGYFLGERQLAGKWLMHDNSLRVPLIIFDPRVKKHRNISSDMVLNIDIAPTLLQLANQKIPRHYQGKSLVPIMKGDSFSEPRDTILVEHLWKFDPIPSSEGVRTNGWKYFRYRFIDAPEELYDLKNDPLETNNLALLPEYQIKLSKFRKKCDELIQEMSWSTQ